MNNQDTRDVADPNRRLVHDLFDQVINAHDPAQVERFYRPDYIQHNPSVPGGIEGVRQVLALLFTAFPDLRGRIELSLSEHDRILVVVEWSGTHEGPFAALPATRRVVRFRSAEIFRIQDGRFAEHWDVVENTDMQVALGLLSRGSQSAE